MQFPFPRGVLSTQYWCSSLSQTCLTDVYVPNQQQLPSLHYGMLTGCSQTGAQRLHDSCYKGCQSAVVTWRAPASSVLMPGNRAPPCVSMGCVFYRRVWSAMFTFPFAHNNRLLPFPTPCTLQTCCFTLATGRLSRCPMTPTDQTMRVVDGKKKLFTNNSKIIMFILIGYTSRNMHSYRITDSIKIRTWYNMYKGERERDEEEKW